MVRAASIIIRSSWALLAPSEIGGKCLCRRMVATEEEGEKREGHRSPLPCTNVRHSYLLVPCLVKVMSVWDLSVVGVLRVALRGTCHSDGLRSAVLFRKVLTLL